MNLATIIIQLVALCNNIEPTQFKQQICKEFVTKCAEENYSRQIGDVVDFCSKKYLKDR